MGRRGRLLRVMLIGSLSMLWLGLWLGLLFRVIHWWLSLIRIDRLLRVRVIGVLWIVGRGRWLLYVLIYNFGLILAILGPLPPAIPVVLFLYSSIKYLKPILQILIDILIKAVLPFPELIFHSFDFDLMGSDPLLFLTIQLS